MTTKDHLLPIQNILTVALRDEYLHGFQTELRQNLDSYDAETLASIFEEACQTPDRGDFIKKMLIFADCDVNKLNKKQRKRPIDFAVESLCKENIEALLTEPTVNIDNQCPEWDGMTPIHYLIRQIQDENFEKVFSCIQVLVENLADVNIPDNNGVSPVSRILKNPSLCEANKGEVYNFFIANTIAVDPNCESYKSLKSVPEQVAEAVWIFDQLKQSLLDKNEEAFLKGLNYIIECSKIDLRQLFYMDDSRFTLLTWAVKIRLQKSVERMLRLGADINYKPPGEYTPIEWACRLGFWEILEIFLRSSQINTRTEQPLLIIITQRLYMNSLVKKCFDLLINSRKVDIDQVDKDNCSALYYAVLLDQKEITRILLEKGAYIGVKNHRGECVISTNDPQSFEDYLDSCITNEISFAVIDIHQAYYRNIRFDYKNLVPPALKQSTDTNDANTSCEEMETIVYMSKCKELRHLLKHPLIQSFLFLKSQGLTLIFYLNILAYFLFSMTFCSYVMTCYLDVNNSDTVKNILWILSWVMTSVIASRELFQLILSPCNYWISIKNYYELTLLSIVAFILMNFDVTNNLLRAITAVSILLVISELFILLGSLEIFAIHYIMLKTVLISFVKGFILYVIILIAFALSFFCLLHKSTKNGINSSQNETTGDEGGDSDFGGFDSVGLSIVKIFVMLTGEFDAGSINFNLNLFSYLLFVLFLFAGPMALFNLLNGLAISDIQEIRSEAELRNLIERVNLLERYEKILCGQHTWCRAFINQLLVISGIGISVLKDLKPHYRFQSTQSENRLTNVTFSNISPRKLSQLLGRKMPTNIWRKAKDVIYRKKLESENEKRLAEELALKDDENKQLLLRITNIENILDSMKQYKQGKR